MGRAIILLLPLFVSCTTPESQQERTASREPTEDNPQDLVAEVNGVRLHYLDWGGDGRLLLLIPGLTHTAHTWDGIAPAFTGRYRVVALTRRSHGFSDKASLPIDLDVLVDDIAGFAALFTDSPAIVVGQSYAGLEMPRLAKRYPSKVGALIFLDAVYDWPALSGSDLQLPGFEIPESFTSYDEMFDWFRGLWPEVWGKPAEAHLRSQTFLRQDGRIAWQFPFTGPFWAGFLEPARRWTAEEYAGIDVPVLSIEARQENVIKASLERRGFPGATVDSALVWVREGDIPWKRRGRELLVDAIPGAVLVDLDSTGHWLHLQRPDRIIEEMSRFLQEHSVR